ncbi:MAG: SnoaL-like domain-containing protein [Cyclobacteriaceae bacterium]
MTTQEIANKWAEYCRSGQWDKAQQELYASDAVSIEMEGAEGYPQKVQGLEAIADKAKQWEQMVEEFHGVEIEGPIVSGDYFTASMNMDIKMKDQPRRNDEEIAIFKVKDSKIVSEQFFYGVE